LVLAESAAHDGHNLPALFTIALDQFRQILRRLRRYRARSVRDEQTAIVQFDLSDVLGSATGGRQPSTESDRADEY
jgi:hypothetical protein